MDLISPPPQPDEPEPTEFAGSEEFFGPRIGACLIDMVVLSPLFVVLSVAIGEASVGGGAAFQGSLGGAGLAWYVALVLLYYFAFEATVGRTVGKLLVGLRVVGRDGGRPSVGSAAIRTLFRLVDWLPLLYLVGFLFMLGTGARRQRLGDLAAGTRVPRAKPIPHRGLASVGLAAYVVLVVAGSVGYVALVGGTVGGTDLDTAQLERLIIDRQHMGGLTLDSVRCPRGVKQRKDNNFQCFGRVADQDVTFQVTQKDNDGNINFHGLEALVYPARAADIISKQLAEQIGHPVNVECGRSRVLAKKVGATFTCHTSSSAGETGTITVTVTDRQGSISWTLETPVEPSTPSST